MIVLSLLDKYYKLYCLDFCGNSTQQGPKRNTEPINLLSSITACTHIIGDGYLKMARSSPWGRVEDVIFSFWSSNVDWSTGPPTTPIVMLFTWDSSNFRQVRWISGLKFGGHYLRIPDKGQLPRN